MFAAGSAVLATGETGVWQLSTTTATPQVIPTQNPPQLTASGADPAGACRDDQSRQRANEGV